MVKGKMAAMAAAAENPVFVESNIATWNDADYSRLLAEADSIFHAKRGTPEGARLDKLATLIEAYEDERYDKSDEVMVLPTKLDGIKF